MHKKIFAFNSFIHGRKTLYFLLLLFLTKTQLSIKYTYRNNEMFKKKKEKRNEHDLLYSHIHVMDETQEIQLHAKC